MRRGEYAPERVAENYRRDPLFWAETRRLVLQAVTDHGLVVVPQSITSLAALG